MDNRELLQIGQVTRKTGTSVDTVRYYERLGLLDKPARSGRGFRLYAPETIEKLRFIKKAQDFGLTLKEIKGIMQSSKQGLKPCCDLVRGLFTKKIQDFESKIKELQRMKKNLEILLSDWISPRDARKRSFVVCPQFERDGSETKRRKSP
ncbi:MAG: heavy metal-responsive transcriptional regulator [Candidatus Omnitrophica bacterium]|nr:heavy metal-responsive transcriptional regulator [Candidatus Omnitrophota bacterium]